MITSETFTVNPDLRPAFEIAYQVYVLAKQQWNVVSDKCRRKLRRQVESSLLETGFNGTPLPYCSEAWVEAKINHDYYGIEYRRDNRPATEHPITAKVIADYIFSLDTVLSSDEYFKIWFENYVSVQTTNEENQRLKTNHQKYMKFGDCWKAMYEAAGVKLIDKPDFRLRETRQAYGVGI